jgi:hypothetical protein
MYRLRSLLTTVTLLSPLARVLLHDQSAGTTSLLYQSTTLYCRPYMDKVASRKERQAYRSSTKLTSPVHLSVYLYHHLATV